MFIFFRAAFLPSKIVFNSLLAKSLSFFISNPWLIFELDFN